MKESSHSFFRWTESNPPSIHLLAWILFQLFSAGQTKQPVWTKLGAGSLTAPLAQIGFLFCSLSSPSSLSSFNRFLFLIISSSLSLFSHYSLQLLPLFHNLSTSSTLSAFVYLSGAAITISDYLCLPPLLHLHVVLNHVNRHVSLVSHAPLDAQPQFSKRTLNSYW